jgi:uncharacterized membrane protein YjjB (DUF3815 family)
MNPSLIHLIHQAFFGGIAAAGFGILFNCPPRMIGLCFCSGALALLVRTLGQDFGMSLPAASFLAALTLAVVDRTWQRAQSPRGSVLAAVGCIAMVPGSLATKGLMGLFAILRLTPGDGGAQLVVISESLLVVTFTLIAIGIGLCIPTLVYPHQMAAD